MAPFLGILHGYEKKFPNPTVHLLSSECNFVENTEREEDRQMR